MICSLILKAGQGELYINAIGGENARVLCMNVLGATEEPVERNGMIIRDNYDYMDIQKYKNGKEYYRIFNSNSFQMDGSLWSSYVTDFFVALDGSEILEGTYYDNEIIFDRVIWKKEKAKLKAIMDNSLQTIIHYCFCYKIFGKTANGVV